MRYIVYFCGRNSCYSESRDAKKHLQNLGGDLVTVTTPRGRVVSMARRDDAGRPYSCHVAPGDYIAPRG